MAYAGITESIVEHILSRRLPELTQLTRYNIAEDFGINISYLSKKFKKDTRTSLFSFIEFEKMTRAKCMIEHNPHLRIEELSGLLGIAKVNQFRKKFKKYYYITPGRYRRSLIRQNSKNTEQR